MTREKDRRERYPERIDPENQPDASTENIPDDVLEHAIEIAVRYAACPDCGHEQFIPSTPGHNTNHDCGKCGFEMRVVG